MAKFKAAAIQMRSGTDIGRNAATFEKMVRDAAANGATYVQTPEMTGALVRDKAARRAAVHQEDRDLIAMAASRLAGELGIYRACRLDRDPARRRQARQPRLAVRTGRRRIATYDKIHMFDVDLDNGESWRESAAYEPGTEAVVADLPFGTAGLRHLLRRALPATFPRRGAGRRRGADRAGGIHPPDRRGALACAAARPRHRERRLDDRRGARRPA